jgi:medium-chain acyl-[acyl-carrier-protein] hydrolase
MTTTIFSPSVRRSPVSTWFRTPRPQARAPRLICFPCAGAGASMYYRWAEALARDGVELVAAQPPGREDRLHDPLLPSVQRLAAAIAEPLCALADRPFALFGHSLGAVVAFEVARELRQRGLEPLGLFVSARRAPQLPLSHSELHRLPRPRFVAALAKLRPATRGVIEDAELLEIFEPLIRADLALSEIYTLSPGAPLGTPVVALAGEQDPWVSVSEVEAWRAVSGAGFELHTFAGGHFFIESHFDEVLLRLRTHLRHMLRTTEAT